MTKYTVTSTLRSAFFNRLAEGTPILFDGGMGTQLYAHGVPFHRCFDELNLLQPDLVQAIQAHASGGSGGNGRGRGDEDSNRSSNSQFGPSEANRVIANYNALTGAQQQDLLNFLRSL